MSRVSRVLIGIVATLAAACSSRTDQRPAPVAPRHLVIITIDTLRADRLGCYGSQNVETPNLDRLAREGAIAPRATSHAPLTRPSHISLFTGRYPSEHGIRDNVSPSFVSEDFPTLAELLHRLGFKTAAFVSSIVLAKQSGLHRGFDTYDDRFSRDRAEELFLNTVQKRGDETTAEANEWMRAQAAKPAERMAVWVHLYDPHDPYDPPEPYATRYAGRPYDGEVAWSDELVGRLIATLRDLGILDQALVIATSDHGEGLGQHQEAGHGFFVYESTLQVPLILRGPGVLPGRRLDGLVRLIDLLPTVLDLLQVSKPAGLTVTGRSIAAAAVRGDKLDEASSYGESLVPLLHFGWSDLRTLRDDRWKYILAPRPELYDLVQDPGELKNLADVQPARASALRTVLESQLRSEQQASRAGDISAIPAELLEELGALGYVSPGGASAGNAAGADPKDKIGEFSVINGLMREGLTKLHEHDYSASVGKLRQLQARGIDSFEVNFYLGRALAGLGRHREAVALFEGAIKRLPVYRDAYISLADSQIALGNLKAAIDALQRGQKAAPKEALFYEREAELWRRLKSPKDAIRAYEALLPLAPTDALIRVRLGELYRDLGEPGKATGYLREGVKLDPSEASYWNSLGMVLGGTGDLVEAEAAFRESVKRNDKEPQYAYNLGLALERQGRRADAIPYFARALELNPNFRAARERLSEAGARRE